MSNDLVTHPAHDAYRAWFAALEAGDAAAAVAVLTADVTMESAGGMMHSGRAEVTETLAPFLRDYVERVRWELTVVGTRGDEVAVRVREETTIRARAGGPSMKVAGWHSGRVRLESDGVWRIAHDVGTIDSAPVTLEVHEFDLPEERAG